MDQTRKVKQLNKSFSKQSAQALNIFTTDKHVKSQFTQSTHCLCSKRFSLNINFTAIDFDKHWITMIFVNERSGAEITTQASGPYEPPRTTIAAGRDRAMAARIYCL